MNEKIYQSETLTSSNFIFSWIVNEAIFGILENADLIFIFGHGISHNGSVKSICKKLTRSEEHTFGISTMVSRTDKCIF